jgi:hypothetical protein
MEVGDRVRWKQLAEAARTWLPIVVSLCAISLTIFQAYSTRRHARLSVQPRLDWTANLGPDGGIIHRLLNVGFGPAILDELQLALDGKVVGPDGPATFAEIDRRLAPAPPQAAPPGSADYLRLMPAGRYCSFYEECWTLE